MSNDEWLTVGKRVAIISHGGTGRDRAEFRVVERLTKTQALLEGGMRFNRSSCREVSARRAGAWSPWWEMTYEADPRVAVILAGQRRRNAEMRATARLNDALAAMRRDDLASAKNEALRAIDQIDLLLNAEPFPNTRCHR